MSLLLFFIRRIMDKKLSNKGRTLLKKLEGVRLNAYQDGGGVWTIGVGSTIGVKQGDVITEETVDILLNKDLERFEEAVNKIEIRQQHKFDAMVIFAFNIGVHGFEKSTLYKKLLKGERSYGIPHELDRWVYDNGRRVNGLVRRRKAEGCLFISGNYFI